MRSSLLRLNPLHCLSARSCAFVDRPSAHLLTNICSFADLLSPDDTRFPLLSKVHNGRIEPYTCNGYLVSNSHLSPFVLFLQTTPLDVLLQPGDILFVPRFWPHRLLFTFLRAALCSMPCSAFPLTLGQCSRARPQHQRDVPPRSFPLRPLLAALLTSRFTHCH